MENDIKVLKAHIKENGKVSRRNFPNRDLGIPSYNTFRRNGIDVEQINDDALCEKYEENPRVCGFCERKIPYEDKKKKYCNSSCSAKKNNQSRKGQYNCIGCDAELDRSDRTYCSNTCQKNKEYSDYIERWLSGLEKGYVGKTKRLSNYIRKYIHEHKGTTCSVCSWDERHPDDGLMLTEIDHIDGDVEHTKFENLRVLCPNCHAMTPTFRARNKNSKRSRN